MIWQRKGKYNLIELAFTEDWRSIVGELALAHMTDDLGRIIVTANNENGWDPDSISNLVSLVGTKLGIDWAWINLAQEAIDDTDKGKKVLKQYLKKYEWI